MIVREVEQILKNSDSDPQAFDRLIDEYREGRDTGELLPLLTSSDSNLVRISVWILSEIHTSYYDSPQFQTRLLALTSHCEPAVRLHSLNALFPLLDHKDPSTRKLLERLQSDENEGVRMMAIAAAAQLRIAG